MTWRKILNDKYEASNDGRIRNARTKREVKQFVGKDGYLRTQVAGKTRLVHRLIGSAFLSKDPERDFINHKDGNKQNNNISNLEWVTRSENEYHAYATGLRDNPLGEKNPKCVLSRDQVEFIKTYYVPRDRDYGAKALAKRFGVAHQTICAVASGQNWKD